MSDRLFRSEKELRDALRKDISDLHKMKREGYDTSGIEQVIKHKKKTLKFGTWR